MSDGDPAQRSLSAALSPLALSPRRKFLLTCKVGLSCVPLTLTHDDLKHAEIGGFRRLCFQLNIDRYTILHQNWHCRERSPRVLREDLQ